MNHLRRGCITVHSSEDLKITYRLALPIKECHVDLFLQSEITHYQRQIKKSGEWTLYRQFVKESPDREDILKSMIIAQRKITVRNIELLERRREDLMHQFNNI